MNKIVYYVASSIDGYISGPDEDVSGFVGEGNGVQQYLADLQDFGTVIMGRRTYEFGYKFGLEPGKPAYPHMEHYIFSSTLTFDDADEKVKIKGIDLPTIDQIRAQADTDIYLCGGGIFAGWLLDHERIDILKIKHNPLILGQGVKIFGDSQKMYKLRLLQTQQFENGLIFNTYRINY